MLRNNIKKPWHTICVAARTCVGRATRELVGADAPAPEGAAGGGIPSRPADYATPCATGMPMYCNNCGARIERDGSSFCPYCGAPLDINSSAKCEYCDNIVSTNDYDWCLASIKGLSQRTVEN